MRFKLKDRSNEYKNGRIKKVFAILPICIGHEIRWLETCYLRQLYYTSWHESGWETIDFVTEDDYKRFLETGKVS